MRGRPDAAGRMTIRSAERAAGPGRSTWLRATLPSMSGLALAAPAQAQELARLRLESFGGLGDLVWIAVTAGTAIAAVAAVSLLLRSRGGGRLAAAQAEIRSLRAELDRTAALLEADDTRTLVLDSAVAEPQVF